MDQKKFDFEAEVELKETELQEKEIQANFDIDAQLRRWLSTAIKASPLSRFAIAARLSELQGREISKFQLDSWTAESKDGYRLPAEFIPALCFILNDLGGLRIQAAPLGVKIMENRDLMFLEYGRLRRMESAIRMKKKQLEKRLRG